MDRPERKVLWLPAAEIRLAIAVEDLFHPHPGLLLDEGVHIHKPPAGQPGQPAAHRGFPAAHEADQKICWSNFICFCSSFTMIFRRPGGPFP